VPKNVTKYTREDLTEQQTQFVDEYLAEGANRRAATEIVYRIYDCKDKRVASAMATRLLKQQSIKDVLVEETVSEFPNMAAQAVEIVKEVLETGQFHGQTVKPNVGLKTAVDVIERGLGAVAQIHQHQVTHEVSALTGSELREAVVAEMKKLGPDEQKQIAGAAGLPMDIIDVEAEPVVEETPPPAKPGPKPKLTHSRPTLEERLAQIKRSKLKNRGKT